MRYHSASICGWSVVVTLSAGYLAACTNGGSDSPGDSRAQGDHSFADPASGDADMAGDDTTGDPGQMPAPEIASLSPTSGYEGTLVTILGQYFDAHATVTFDAMPAVTDLVIATDGRSLAVRAPAHASGVTSVTITNPGGKHATLANAFTYLETVAIGWCGLEAPLALSAVLGANAPEVTGLVYAATATVGAGQGAGITVEVGVGPVGEAPATSSAWVWRSTSYRGDIDGLSSGDLANDRYGAALPMPHSAGIWEFAVRVSGDEQTWRICDGGTGSEDGYQSTNAGRLTVTETGIALTSIEPVRGREGAVVTLRGVNFTPGATVTFDTSAATDVAFVSATTLTAKAPAHAQGAVDVTVTNPDSGTATLSAAFTYTGDVGWCALENPLAQQAVFGGPTPTATALVWTPGITPGAGRGEGVFVQVGVGLPGLEPSSSDWIWRDMTYSADVDGYQSGDLANDRYAGELPMPGGAFEWEFAARASTDQQVWVYCDGGDGSTSGYSSSNAGRFTVRYPDPVLTTISPSHGPIGTLVTILGANFFARATVSFDAVAGVDPVVVDQSTMTVKAPPHVPGSVNVVVMNSDLTWGAKVDAFLYEASPEAPVITGVVPNHGSIEGGTVVTVTGSQLTGVDHVTFAHNPLPATLAPDGLSLTFTTPYANAAGPVTLTITNASDQSTTLEAAFRYTLQLPPGHTLEIDGDESDWSGGNYTVASDVTVSNWGDYNRLATLDVAYDDANLYLAIRGAAEAGGTNNAIVAYLDRDFGNGTGLTTITTGMDGSGALDDACSANLDASGVTGFGAEFCLGSRGMAEVTLDSVWQATDYAGVRDLTSDAGNFGWAVDGSGKSLVRVATNGGAGPLVEIAVPFTSVFGPAGLPEGGAHLAVFVRLVSASGNDLSNQSLPADDAAHPNTVNQVAIIDVQ